MSRAIAVIGQGAPDGGPAADAARSVGRLLAQAGATVVTGGLGGVMAAAGSGARAAGGRVTAILPGTDRRAAREADTVVCSGVGEARDLAVVASADAVIAVGGGWGTLSEIAHASQLGRRVIGLGSWQLTPAGKLPDGTGITLASSAAEAVRLALA